jgi:hypothetical protein
MRNAGRVLADGLIAVVLSSAILAVGIFVGRNYERTNAVAAEPSAPIVTIGKKQAAARNDPICRTVRSDRRGQR